MNTVPARRRGSIALDEHACTSCMVCARERPDWCISIGSHAEEVRDEGRAGRPGRVRVVHRLDHFEIDYSLCLYCGICVEVCPFDALSWTPEPVRAGGVPDLREQRAALTARGEDVPAPVLLEVGALPPEPKDSGRGRGGGRRHR